MAIVGLTSVEDSQLGVLDSCCCVHTLSVESVPKDWYTCMFKVLWDLDNHCTAKKWVNDYYE